MEDSEDRRQPHLDGGTEKLDRSSASCVPRRRLRLQVASGPDQGASVDVGDEPVRVGTSALNHLVLRDPTVSRRHFEIHRRPEGYLLRDCGSTNGTFVGAVRVSEAHVLSGVVVRAGSIDVRVTALPDELLVPIADDMRCGRLLGASAAMRELFVQIARTAAGKSTVLIEGETGVGKELVAEEIHERSPRASRPLVVFDCGSAPAGLIESELFGHERGAFTGAESSRRGLFEEAEGGTLFIDEVGELDPAVQPKLLRAIEAREVRPVGSNRVLRVDVRIVAATNRDLEREIESGAFRADLYHRLAVVRLGIPPLRERSEDVELLAQHFYADLSGQPDARIEPALVAQLARLPWPGNVRELRNYVERLVLLGAASPAGAARPPDDLIARLASSGRSLGAAREELLDAFEPAYVAELLRRFDGNVTRAAAEAGITRRHLHRLKTKHGL